MEGWGLLSSITSLPPFSKLLGSINDWNQLQVMSLSGQSCPHPLPAGISPTALSGIWLTLDKLESPGSFFPFTFLSDCELLIHLGLSKVQFSAQNIVVAH